ncbi:hypothetical protein BGZ80_002027 [Entomortierella chlamydospora]|uniref:BYS1 domain protein n=1 Tax=Entomortierella chlamydospora TaxID=101097 RepID=A0A9P6T379_9FUNG|nr:hypothetical protein BGZ79_000352 [Entomortierella chlamydospora]KAG0021620.1 hypothetical protein BGZ80_002027 [Entomortierella chlamydospora]
MVRFTQLLACVPALMLVAKAADTSFAYCIAVRQRPDHEAIGFKIWSHKGDNGEAYDTATPGQESILVASNNWAVTAIGLTTDYVEDLFIQNNKYSFEPTMRFRKICEYQLDGSHLSSAYYGCYSNGDSWCKDNQGKYVTLCNKKFNMGDDSWGCSSGKP